MINQIKHLCAKYFTVLVILGFLIRILYAIYYYFDGFGILRGYGDIELNYLDAVFTLEGRLSNYPPLSLMILILLLYLSAFNMKLFMLWIAALEITLTALTWFVLKDLLGKKSKSITKEAEEANHKGKAAINNENNLKFAYLLFVFNPFWIYHNIASINYVGYHPTDIFFLYAYLGLIYFHQKGKTNLAYIFLALSAAMKLFTLAAIGLFALKLFLEKEYRECIKFLAIQVAIILATILPALLFYRNIPELLITWIGTGSSIPIYFRVILPVVLLIYLIAILKSQNLSSLSGYSLIVFFSYSVLSVTYWRYLLGLIYNGILDKRFEEKTFELKILNLKLSNHEMMFVISILGVIISILTVITGLIQFR